MSEVRSDVRKRRGGRTEHPDLGRGGRAGYGTPARVTMPYNFETVTNPKDLAGLVQSSLDSLVNQLNTIFAQKLDKIDPRGRMLSDAYSDAQGRPVKLRKGGTDVDVDVDDVFEKGVDDADDIPESATKKWAAESGADITSANTAANITGQGALATKGSVDLATAEVTNKTAANIAETAGLKWAAESGADVTSANTAANIASQGALATKNQVDTAEIVANAVTTVKIAGANVTWTLMAADAVRADVIKVRAIEGWHLVESVVDEFQTMGSSLSDAQFDDLTAP